MRASAGSLTATAAYDAAEPGGEPEVSAGPWLETGPRLEVCATVAAYDGAEPWRSGRNDECGPWGGGICGETDDADAEGGSARRSSIFAC